jgi:hypothetical protein
MTCFHYKTGTGLSAHARQFSSCLISPNHVSRVERGVAPGTNLTFSHYQSLTAHDHIPPHHVSAHGAINEFQPFLSTVFLLYSRVHGLHPPAASSIDKTQE